MHTRGKNGPVRHALTCGAGTVVNQVPALSFYGANGRDRAVVNISRFLAAKVAAIQRVGRVWCALPFAAR